MINTVFSQKIIDSFIIPGQIHKPCGKYVPFAFEIISKVDFKTGKAIPPKYKLDELCNCFAIEEE